VEYHANAKLTLRGRRELVDRMQAGWAVSEIAEMMNVSRPTVYKWWKRWQVEGDDGLRDRSSRPRSCPQQTPHERSSGVSNDCGESASSARLVSLALCRCTRPRCIECWCASS
jgi:transposase-like protein